MIAPESWRMPGIKETSISIGLNKYVVNHLAGLTNDVFALNTYAHFLVRFGTIVKGIERKVYRDILNTVLQSIGETKLTLTKEILIDIVSQFEALCDVPEDPFEQLTTAIEEIYKCWFTTEAIDFRETMVKSSGIGVAVIVQSLGFGGTGICFSRNPLNGDPLSMYGNFWNKEGVNHTIESMKANDPALCSRLRVIATNLELYFRDMIQFEFVMQNDGGIQILQVNSGMLFRLFVMLF